MAVTLIMLPISNNIKNINNNINSRKITSHLAKEMILKKYVEKYSSY